MNKTKAEICIENLLNGNIKDAKRQAKRLSGEDILETAKESFGCTEEKALATVAFLSDAISFQTYCDV